MTVTLEPPKPTVQTGLKPVVIPKTRLRLTTLTEILTHMGADAEVIRRAQQGFASGDMQAVVIEGRNAQNFLVDQVTLSFDELARDEDVTLMMAEGRSMTESLSLKFARMVEYSVATMRRKGLRLVYIFRFRPHIGNDPAAFSRAMVNYNLTPHRAPGCPPGMALRQVYRVTPGLDRGMHLSHATAWAVR